MELNIFGRKFFDYIKPTWPYITAVFLIGQIQLGAVFYLPADIQIFFDSIPHFLRLSQLLWVIIIIISLFVAVRKYDFTLKQIQFLGLLYFIVFGVLKVFVRAVFLGHDLNYLFLGHESAPIISAPFVECFVYIFLITIIVGWGFIKDKEIAIKR
jgi:hypothetical protein